MGIQHYKLKVIPEGLTNKINIELYKYLEDNWPLEGIIINPKVLKELRHLLPKNTSWSYTEEYCTENCWGSDLRIWKEGDKVQSTDFRYSPSTDHVSLLNKFVEIIAQEKFLLYSEESKIVIPPDVNLIVNDMLQSRAYRILEDPEKVIIESAGEIKNKSNKKLK